MSASVSGKKILDRLDLSVGADEVHAIMGPNGSGKSTLGNTLMGSPKCAVTGGSVFFKGVDLLGMAPYERALKGFFLAFQHPVEVQGLKYLSFLKRAAEARGSKMPLFAFKKKLDESVSNLSLPQDFSSRDVNHGFSGGEKKRAEVVQLELLDPELALLDEIDSGLDVDTLRSTASQISEWRASKGASIVLMTHYKRILDYLKPDFVHVMVAGRIVRSGGSELADEIDARGYGAFGVADGTAAPGPLAAPPAQKESTGEYESLLKSNKEKAPHAGGRIALKTI